MFRTAHMIPMIFLAASAPEISAWGWNSDAFSILDEASIKYVCKNCRPISLANVSLKILEYVGMNDSHAGSLISTASFQRAAIASNIDPL